MRRFRPPSSRDPLSEGERQDRRGALDHSRGPESSLPAQGPMDKYQSRKGHGRVREIPPSSAERSLAPSSSRPSLRAGSLRARQALDAPLDENQRCERWCPPFIAVPTGSIGQYTLSADDGDEATVTRKAPACVRQAGNGFSNVGERHLVRWACSWHRKEAVQAAIRISFPLEPSYV